MDTLMNILEKQKRNSIVINKIYYLLFVITYYDK